MSSMEEEKAIRKRKRMWTGIVQFLRVEVLFIYGCALLGKTLNTGDPEKEIWGGAFMLLGVIISIAVNICVGTIWDKSKW